MKGLPRRIPFRRRPSDPSPQETQPTIVAPAQAPPAEPLPAGLAPEDVAPTRTSFRDRGRLRRRLRYLRRVRELGFRDLGGLVFDLHRFARRNDELVLGKLAALDAVDRELRAIERVLNERRDILELREPGVAACPRCGALHGSDAKFCPQCGTQFSGPLAIGEVGGAPAPAPPHSAAEAAATQAAATEVAAASAGELGPTPVSAALGQAPAPAALGQAPAPDAPAAPGAPAAPTAPAEAAGDQPTQAFPVPPAADQPTQAIPPVEPPNGETHSSPAVTDGDPLAQRDRPEA
jgi:ribosomal protein L40E